MSFEGIASYNNYTRPVVGMFPENPVMIIHMCQSLINRSAEKGNYQKFSTLCLYALIGSTAEKINNNPLAVESFGAVRLLDTSSLYLDVLPTNEDLSQDAIVIQNIAKERWGQLIHNMDLEIVEATSVSQTELAAKEELVTQAHQAREEFKAQKAARDASFLFCVNE
jgi:hypothetical protein